MLDHENLQKKSTEKKWAKTYEDVTNKSSLGSVTFEPLNTNQKKSVDDFDESVNDNWLKKRLEHNVKFEKFISGADKNKNMEAFNIEKLNIERDKIENLNANERAAIVKSSKSELRQRQKNSRMVVDARQVHVTSSLNSMEEVLKKRNITIENKDLYRDLSQFVCLNSDIFSEEDKDNLVDAYLRANKAAQNSTDKRQDMKMVLDIMIKALFSIDIPSASFDSDTSLARNAAAFESLLGQVAAFDIALKKYEYTGKDNEVVTYFSTLGKEAQNSAMERYNRLKNVVLLYVSRRSMIDTDTKEKENSNKDAQVEKQHDHKLKDAVLEDAYKKMGYFGEEGKSYNSSKAVQGSTTFKGFFGAIKDFKDTIGFFSRDSFRTKAINTQVDEIDRLLEANASDFVLGRDRFTYLRAFTNLAGICANYIKTKNYQEGENKRYDSVVELSRYALNGAKFFRYITDDQLSRISEGQGENSLKEVFSNSEYVVEAKEEQVHDIDNNILYNMHTHFMKSEIDANVKSGSKLSFFKGILVSEKIYLNSFVGKKEVDFNKVKADIESNYNNAILRCSEYLKNASPSFSSSRKRYMLAIEALNYSKAMYEKIKNITFGKIAGKNRDNLSWSELIFDNAVVQMREETQNNRVVVKETYTDEGYKFTTEESAKKEYANNKAIKFITGDTSFCREYKKAKLQKADGSSKEGFAYKDNIAQNYKFRDSNMKFDYVSAKTIFDRAKELSVNIIYSENALKQLTTIRIIDTIMGKKTRSLNSLVYNARTESVFGQNTLVIASVLTKENSGFFGRDVDAHPNNEEAGEFSKEVDVSILDEKGNLKIGAYDRNVADKIMSLSSKDCLSMFEENGMNLTKDEKEDFVSRFRKVKIAFKSDKEKGWRKKRDESDKIRIEKKINEEKSKLKLYKRYGLGDDNEAVIAIKTRIDSLKNNNIIDREEMYNGNLAKAKEEGKDFGLVISEFVNDFVYLEKDYEPVVVRKEGDLTREERIQNAKNKIYKIRQARNNFTSFSDNLRKKNKKSFKDIINSANVKYKELIKDEMKAILEAFDKYADMDVTLKTMLDRSKDENNVNREDYQKESDSLIEAITLAENREKELAKMDKNSRAVKFETSLLNALKGAYSALKGTLEVPGNAEIVDISDDQFVTYETDKESGTAKNEKKENEMIDRTKEELFPHEPCVEDVGQGCLGDCYLISLLAGIVNSRPMLIKNMLKDNGDGTVTVRFFKGYDEKNDEKIRVYCRVKKTTPKQENGSGDKYARGALWVKMIEKAFVASGIYNYVLDKEVEKKGNGTSAHDKKAVAQKLSDENKVSYDLIEGGDAQYAGPVLTGEELPYIQTFKANYEYKKQIDTKNMTLSEKEKEFLKKAYQMRNVKEKSLAYSLLAYSTMEHEAGGDTGLSEGVRRSGVYHKHGYTVLGAEKIDDEDFIIVRNPHATHGTTEKINTNTGAVVYTSSKSDDETSLLYMPANVFFSIFKEWRLVSF